MEAVMTQHIVMTPGVMSGRSRIEGTRIRVMDIVTWYYTDGRTVAEILSDYPYLTEAQVFAALLFFADNRELVTQEAREEDEEMDRLAFAHQSRPTVS